MSMLFGDMAEAGAETTELPPWTPATCPACGNTKAKSRLRPDGMHYAELVCRQPGCNSPHRWLPKPRGLSAQAESESAREGEPERETLTMSTATTQNPSATTNPWMIPVTNGGGAGDYEVCPAKNHLGVIVGLFDIGHHRVENQKKQLIDQRKLVILYELRTLRKNGRPFVLGERVTFSMSEKANFYALACNVTGRKFRDGEQFDPRSLLGIPVMVNVTHTEKGEGEGKKIYHNIGSIAQFPEGFDPPTPTITPFSWSIMEGRPFPEADWYPLIYGKSIKTLVSESNEYGARGPSMSVVGGRGDAGPHPTVTSPDDIPF